MKQYQLYVNYIYKYYCLAKKKTGKLKEIQSILQLAKIKFYEVFHTQWLLFEGAIDAIVSSLDPLYTVLIEDSNLDPTAKSILNFMVAFNFLATTYLLADVLPVLARLSRWFQRSHVDFTTVTDGVSITTSTPATFKPTPGPKFENFFSQVPSIPSSSQSLYCIGHKISDSRKQREDFDRNRRNLIDELVENL